MNIWRTILEYITVKLIFIGVCGALLNFVLNYTVNKFAASIEFADNNTVVWQISYALAAFLVNDWNRMYTIHSFRRENRIITKSLKKNMWFSVSNDDPSHVKNCDVNLNKAINDASLAFSNVIEHSSYALINISTIISYLLVIYKKSHTVGIWILLISIVNAFAGSAIMKKNHTVKSEFNKRMNPLENYLKSLTEGFLFDIINGDSEKTLVKISAKTSEKDKELAQINYEHHRLCAILFVILSVSVATSIALNSGDFASPVQIAAIFKVSLEMCERSWGLYNIFSTLSTASAEWASYKKYSSGQASTQSMTKSFLKNIREAKLILFGTTNVPNHVRIDGPKGSGKTTWIESSVFQLYRVYQPGQAIYVHQKVNVPISKFGNIRDYITNDAPGIDDAIILKWSRNLGIYNKVNEQTLNQPFDGLSGGETKLVNILKYFLPILCGNPKQTRVVFGDEITANLDKESQDKVRKLLNSVKKYALVIEADHNPSNVFSIPVKSLKVCSF